MYIFIVVGGRNPPLNQVHCKMGIGKEKWIYIERQIKSKLNAEN